MLMWRVDAQCARTKYFAFMRKISCEKFAYMRKLLYLCIQKGGDSPAPGITKISTI